METALHNVRDLSGAERSVAERLVGHALKDDQRLLIQVVGDEPTASSNVPAGDELPAWCNVYEGLSDERIAALEHAISRRLDLTRS